MFKFLKRGAFHKLFITIGILALYRIAMLIVIPGIDIDSIPQLSSKSLYLGTLNIFSGGSIDKCSILATNIMPYITATIITQIFSSKSIGIEYFQNLKKDREIGDMKRNEWTQYFTVFISFINAVYISNMLLNTYKNGISVVYYPDWLFYMIAIPAMMAGSLFVVWLANQISKSGIGQGTSMIIFANIISNSAGSFKKIYDLHQAGSLSTFHLILIVTFFLTLFFIVIFIEGCNVLLVTRYAGVTGKQVDQKLPFKINNAGVMPSILASSFAAFPSIAVGFFDKLYFRTSSMSKIASYFAQGSPIYYVMSALLIFAFTIAQSEISFDPADITQNLQESGAVVKDTRPGEDTYKKLSSILFRLNFLAGIYLIIVCILSEYFCNYINQVVGDRVLQLSGTAVLILVSTTKLIFDGIQQYDYVGILNKMKTK